MYVKTLIKNKRLLAVIGMTIPVFLTAAILLGININGIKNVLDRKTPETSVQIKDGLNFKFSPHKKTSISFVDKQAEPGIAIAQDSSIKARLINQNQELEMEVTTTIRNLNNNEYLITLNPQTNQTPPGLYQLEIEYADNGQTKTFTQDFSWGVLAINTNKAVYQPKETAKIALAVLDQNGSMVCDAKVSLKITGPKRTSTSLSTDNGSIKVNPGCHKKEMIMEPDFEANYQTQGEGTYNLELVAETENGSYTIKDSFQVASTSAFDIERITATRIYPKANYPVVIAIKANENYQGPITEKLPAKYKVTGLSEEQIEQVLGHKMEGEQSKNVVITEENNTKTLAWEVDWQKGQTYYLSYEYDAPNRSPDFHLLGPLQIGSYIEQRQWQIAVDDLNIIDVHSSPEEGEDWIIRFETNGNYDLKIIPDDQATIDDDEFTSLSCDGEERTPQILEGDVIYYPNWECDGTSRVVHKTLKAGNHTLRFEYGGDVAYAYNAIWKVGWDYRKSLTFTGSTGGAQTDYVMRVRAYYGSGTDTSDQVYCSSNCRTDFGDVRFTSTDGTTDLDYWLQSYVDSTSAIFWVEVDSIPASPSTSNIYMYYSNSSATTTSSGADTYQFFDDFSGDLSQWTIDPANTDPTIYISSGSLRHDPDSTQSRNGYYDTRMITSSFTAQNGILEYDIYMAGAARIIHQMGFRVDSLNFTNGYNWRMQNSATDGGWFEFVSGAWQHRGANDGPYSSSTWREIKLNFDSSNYTANVNGGADVSTSDSTKTTSDYLISHVHGVSLTAASYVLIDNVRVRKVVTPEPTYSGWGSQEVPLIDITGTAYTDDDEGSTLNGVDVCAAVAATFTPGDCDTTSSGVFDIQDVAVSGSSSQQITLFVDGGSTFGNVVTNHYVDNITGLKLYQNHILLDYFTGDSISIIDMDAYDNDQNSTDMLYDATDSSPDTLTWESGIELYVPSGNTFVPGGNTNGHDIEIDGLWTASSGETINVDGSFKLDSGGTFNESTTTLTFDATSGTEDLITDGAGDIYNLVINDGGGGSLVVEVEDPVTILNNLTITNGSLDVKTENNQINLRGNWTNDDTFVERSGTVVFDGASDATIDSGCSDEDTCTSENFYNLTINKSEDAKVTLSTTHLRVTNLLNVVTGWLIQGALNVRAEGTTAININDFGRWSNTSTGNLTLGGNLINDGNLTLNANGMSCGDTKSITIASTDTSSRLWSGQGGFRISDVVVSYQTGSAIVYAANSTNSGNMGSNWRFVECNESLFDGINLDGVSIN